MPNFQCDMGPTSGAASQTGSVHGPTANINMVGGGAQAPLGMAPMHPVLVGLWRNMKKPKFSGLQKDSAQFVGDWTEVETIIHSSSTYPVSDFELLLELRGCLDEASSEVLKTRMIYEKNLEYQEYWDSFRQEWGIDMLKQNRMDWYAVKLIPTGPKG